MKVQWRYKMAVSKRKKTKIQESLQTLDKTDVYSLLLFTLFKMHDVPEYASLSELCYILDGDNLSKLLSYYGGMTIRIPTLKELRLMTQALLLFQYINLDQEPVNFEDALETVCNNEFNQKEMLDAYKKIADIVANYEFSRK
jgi:hypothetical protein